MRIILISIIIFELAKEFVQLIFFESLPYFLSFQNLLELTTYSISLCSLFAKDYSSQSSYGSVAVLFAYILLPLFIQKVIFVLVLFLSKF